MELKARLCNAGVLSASSPEFVWQPANGLAKPGDDLRIRGYWGPGVVPCAMPVALQAVDCMDANDYTNGLGSNRHVAKAFGPGIVNKA